MYGFETCGQEGAHTRASRESKRSHEKPPENKTEQGEENVRRFEASRSTAMSLTPSSVMVGPMALRLEGKKEHTLRHLENPKEVMGSLQETRPDKEKRTSADPRPPGRLLFLSFFILFWLNVRL